MFGRKRKAGNGSVTAADALRGLLYGDAPIEQFAGSDEFAAVRDALAAGDTATARLRLRAIVATPGHASREYLQAWHELRALGEMPGDPTRLYGLVVDLFLRAGLETLAAYDDGTCRYLHSSGRVLVWEAQDERVDEAVRDLLALGREVVANIGPWEGPRPALRNGNTRLSMLCAGGLYFGDGPARAMQADPLAGELIGKAEALLQVLTSVAVGDGR